MEGVRLNLLVSGEAEKLDFTLIAPLSPNFTVGLLRPLVYVSKRLLYFYLSIYLFFACMHIKTVEMRSVFLSCLESSHEHTSQVLWLPGSPVLASTESSS